MPPRNRAHAPGAGASRGHRAPPPWDKTYGSGFLTKANQLGPAAREEVETLGRQALHAYMLAIKHPLDGRHLEFRSELPDDLIRLRRSLGAQGTPDDRKSLGLPKA